MKKLDEWLGSFGGAQHPPLPGRPDDAAWDENAEKIVARALSAGAAASDVDALLSAPALAPEAGESGVGQSAVKVGVSSMSDSERPKPSAKRPSLKELAERVSKTPPPSSVATPLPALSTPLPTRASQPALSTPLPSAAASSARGSLTELAKSASAAPPPSASAPPPSASVPAPASQAPASAPPPASVAPAAAAGKVVALEPKKAPANEGGGGSMMGLFIALGGIAAAAALFFVLRGNSSAPTTAETRKPAATAAETSQAEAPSENTAAPVDTATQVAGPSEPKKDDAVDINSLEDTSANPEAVPAPNGSIAQNDAVGPAGPPKPVKVDPDGTLDEAMKKAAGDLDKKEEQPQPASEENRPKNVPDQPPQGSVTAAVGSVMGGAKACVAGADDVSRATITFGSSGAVQSVSVSGWAAGKPAASCIQSALKGANVGPFSKPTYSFGVTIRP